MKKKYKNLIQNAGDIIFETDVNGNFTFVNDFTVSHLGYSKEEIIGKPIIDFVRRDYKQIVNDFNSNILVVKDDFSTLDFPVIRKDLSQIWGSVNVYLIKNQDGLVIGYSGIMRDITVFKYFENNEKKRIKKIKNYNKVINDLSTLNFAHADNFADVLHLILKRAAKATKSDLVSYWNYENEQITSRTEYDLITRKIAFCKSNPDDFKRFNFTELKEKKIINIPELKNMPLGYCPRIDSRYNSILLMSVFHNNLLRGVLCFSNFTKNKVWDNEDLNFTRTISNLISVSLELQLRLKSEKLLKYKTEVLSIVSRCTEMFLSSSQPIDDLEVIFELIGNATNVTQIYYHENDSCTGLISRKVRWAREKKLSEITPLQYFTHENLAPILNQASSKKPFIAKVTELEDGFVKDLFNKNGICSVIIFPMFFNNDFSGLLVFNSTSEERIWTQDEINIFQLFTNNISSVLQRSKNEKLRNESEQRFELLANNIPGTVYLSKFDAHWTKIFITDQIEELTGYNKAEFIEQRINFLDLVHEEDRDEVLKNSRAKINNGEKLHLSYRIRTKENTIKWIDEFADIIKENDQIKYVEGIFIDITNKKNNESAIFEKELAQKESRAKSAFLANMSHEIRTPLNGIIGFTDLLMKTTLSIDQANYMITVHKSANALLGIVNNILDFSKIEAGKLNIEYQPVVVNELIESIGQIVRYDLEQKKIKLNILVDNIIPKILLLDPTRIQQVLLNLVSNAIKFTDKGQVTIRLKLNKIIDKDTYSIRFCIIDTGVGIALENQKKIFIPFGQEDNSTTRKYGGTGLGLNITNKLLELMGGKLKLKSIPNKGSIFYFNLEVKKVDAVMPKQEKVTINSSILEITDLTIKILIAEDNAINMLLIKTILKGIFPKVQLYESVNGEEVVNKFQIVQPDLILMDIQMPLLNGIEATQKIRALNPTSQTPIIALTAGTLKEEREMCFSAGMNDFITKPIVKETIKDVILKWIDLKDDSN